MKRDLAKFLRRASACGWQVTRTRKSHWRLRHPNGGLVVTGTTPSDFRALANLRAMLRRVERGTAA
jgi:predicted RNA binding protein YcfA (HicA-like mRNA interferase family)